jgi:hypothetical protein
MATLCRAYTTEQDAQAAVDRLLSGGVASAEVQVLMGDAVHDARDAPVGGFAATSTAGAETVGTYAGVGHSGRGAMGTFAGDAEEQRRGGFWDVDRETVTTYRDGVKRVRIASHHNLMQNAPRRGARRANRRVGCRGTPSRADPGPGPEHQAARRGRTRDRGLTALVAPPSLSARGEFRSDSRRMGRAGLEPAS